MLILTRTIILIILAIIVVILITLMIMLSFGVQHPLHELQEAAKVHLVVLVFDVELY